MGTCVTVRATPPTTSQDHICLSQAWQKRASFREQNSKAWGSHSHPIFHYKVHSAPSPPPPRVLPLWGRGTFFPGSNTSKPSTIPEFWPDAHYTPHPALGKLYGYLSGVTHVEVPCRGPLLRYRGEGSSGTWDVPVLAPCGKVP